ncbi:MAG: AMP-binding protein, partial [Opitutales bacterium]
MKLGEALSLAIDRGQFHGPGNDRRAAGGSKLLRTVGGERKGSRSGRRVRIVISEREPLRFLEILAAALREGHHVFLANPDWKETEWRSAEEQVRPDAIWKDGKLTLVEKEEKEIDFREGEDVYVGVPTGGTGGRIRFALHTESTFTAAVDGFRRFFGVERIDSTCLLPLFHVSGLMQVMRALFTGGAVRFAPLPFRPGDALPFPADENSAFVSLVPTQLRRFLDSASSL